MNRKIVYGLVSVFCLTGGLGVQSSMAFSDGAQIQGQLVNWCRDHPGQCHENDRYDRYSERSPSSWAEPWDYWGYNTEEDTGMYKNCYKHPQADQCQSFCDQNPDSCWMR